MLDTSLSWQNKFQHSVFTLHYVRHTLVKIGDFWGMSETGKVLVKNLLNLFANLRSDGMWVILICCFNVINHIQLLIMGSDYLQYQFFFT